jgi:hypothetical protein
VVCAGFWVPEGAESGSSEDEEEGSDAAGSSEDVDLDMEAAAGLPDSEGELMLRNMSGAVPWTGEWGWQ